MCRCNMWTRGGLEALMIPRIPVQPAKSRLTVRVFPEYTGG
jgi:hypothetical protein